MHTVDWQVLFVDINPRRWEVRHHETPIASFPLSLCHPAIEDDDPLPLDLAYAAAVQLVIDANP